MIEETFEIKLINIQKSFEEYALADIKKQKNMACQ
jgi:hypothetical protein